MGKRGGTPSCRDKHVTPAAISPPGVARGRFVGGQQSGLAGCKPPPLLMRGASSCSSQGRHRGEPWGASPPPSAPTYLPAQWIPTEPWLSRTPHNVLFFWVEPLVSASAGATPPLYGIARGLLGWTSRVYGGYEVDIFFFYRSSHALLCCFVFAIFWSDGTNLEADGCNGDHWLCRIPPQLLLLFLAHNLLFL